VAAENPTVGNGGEMPPLSVSVNGDTVTIQLRCERCANGMRLRSVPPVQARVFLKALMKTKTAEAAAENVEILCSECELEETQRIEGSAEQ